MAPCSTVLEAVEADLEGMLLETRERLIRELDSRERACLLGKLAAYRCAFDRVCEAKETVALAEAREGGAEAGIAPAGGRKA